LQSIGPPCCGKSTFIRALGETTVDFNLYDRSDMFETVSLALAVELGSKADRAASQQAAPSNELLALKLQKSHTMTMYDRIQRIVGTEKMLIALVFTHNITIDFFKTRLMILMKGQQNVKILIESITELLKKRSVMVSL
jgi:adenylate kinase family enzyme